MTGVARRRLPFEQLVKLLPGVLRKNSIRASRGDFLEPILMMESAENDGASNCISRRNTMPMSALLRVRT